MPAGPRFHLTPFRRKPRPPAELLAGLDAQERWVSWADTHDGAVIMATSHGLWWPAEGSPRRIPWQHIAKVTWREGVMTVVEAEVVDDLLLVDQPAMSVRLSTPRDLPPVVRKRIETNIVRRELVTVPGGVVRFVARRRPGQDGLAWWAHLEEGTRDSVPLRSAIRARIETLRAQTASSQD